MTAYECMGPDIDGCGTDCPEYQELQGEKAVAQPVQAPTIGRFVHYTLDAEDAERINDYRDDFDTALGNTAHPGDTFPLLVTRVFESDGPINGQVFLDGNDSLWVTSVHAGEGEGTWAWPTIR